MKLHEWKTRALAKIMAYAPKNERERYLIDNITYKITYVRASTMPNCLHTIHLALKDNEVSDELKGILRSVIPSEEDVNEFFGAGE